MNRLISIVLVCLLQVSLAVASTFNLRVEVTPNGAGSLNTSGGTYEEGSMVNLRTYGNTGYVFKGWYEGETQLSSATSFNYTMLSNDAVVQARYEYDPAVPADPAMPDTTTYYSFTATVSPVGAGTLNTYSGRYSAGATVNMRAYVNTGYQFVGWQNDSGETVATSTSFNYTMPGGDAQITALYVYDPSVPLNPDSMATRYTVTVASKPVGGGTFNTTSVTQGEGSSVRLYAYTNTGYRFLHWENELGEVIATAQNFDYIIPHGNSKVFGIFEFDPAPPANPSKNYWNKELGEVIVDDFATGSLGSAVSQVISGSSANDVAIITVAGVMNNNDFGIANNYKNCILLDLCRVTGITAVPSYAFDYTNLESVYLPASIEQIGYRAFYECKQLSSLIVYAMTPPALENDVFTGISEGLVVYVPAAAIAQYQDAKGWKDFTILPIQEDIRSITVLLPEGTNTKDYAQMWLELTNTKSGQKMHYVMTDRMEYNFANIIRNTSWNVTLRNERGDVFGRIDNVEVKDEDVTVTFASLSKPQHVSLTIVAPDGQDVTKATQITWTDASGAYLAQGTSLAGLPAGYQMNYHVTLSQELAMMYNTPASTTYTLKEDGNTLTCSLEAIQQIQFSGKVKDATTGLPLSGAVISASQTFGGKYSKTQNVKTDKNGVFTLDVARVPTSVAFAATDYVSQTMDFLNNEFDGLNEFSVPDVSLKPIVGATISLGFTYTTVEGETQSWYSDYQNVSYALFNVTKNRAVSQFNVQYPQIVLLEEVEDGDVLKLTATSRAQAFQPVETTATIAEQKAEVTFAITELGCIEASFTKNGNAAVVGSLYDSAGKLLKIYNYSEAKLTISDLADGNYTLVSMGSSRLFNTIYDLAQLPQTGLNEGTDYVQNMVEVKSGAISTVSIYEVPTLDESKLYYTGDNTSFTVNKPSIVAGNYLTLTGRIDFKPAYATSVSNVQMIVDMPESCEFVENSVMVGNSTSSYTLNGNRITIPMTRYTDRVRFCIIPTLGGDYAPSAFVQFDLEGETVTQPIGSANYTAKDLSISVPSTVAKTSVPVSGTAIGTSNVEIYDNDVLIGQTTSLANGTWATTCELNEPYNLSTHNIVAKVTTKADIELQTETIECIYDKDAIEVNSVTMINTAHGSSNLALKDYVTVFDFQNPNKSNPAYWYWPSYPDFTFIVDFTSNDTTVVSNVILHVKLSNNTISRLVPKYDSSKNKWIVCQKFYTSALPSNVSVTFDVNSITRIEREEIEAKYQSYEKTLGTYINIDRELEDSLDTLIKREKDFELLTNKLDSISEALHNTTDEVEEKELWTEYFTISGHKELIDSIKVDAPSIISENYQTALLSRIDSLLSMEIAIPDALAWEMLMSKTDSLLNSLNDSIDYDASFTSFQESDFYWNEEGINKRLRKISLEDIDLSSFPEEYIYTVDVSDGSQLIIGVYNGTTIWIDTYTKTGWLLEDESVAFQAKSVIRRAKSDIETLKDYIKILESVWNRIMSAINPIYNSIKNSYNDLQREYEILDHLATDQFIKADKCQREIASIEKELNNMRRSVPSVEDWFVSRQIQLKNRMEALRKSSQYYMKQGNEVKIKQGKLKIKAAKVGAVLGTVTDCISLIKNSWQLIIQIKEGVQDWNNWCSFIDHILPCSAQENQALSIKNASECDRNIIIAKYIGCGIATLAAIGSTAYLMTNKVAGKTLKIVLGSIVKGAIPDLLSNYSDHFFKIIKRESKEKRMKHKSERRKLVCGENNGYDGYDDMEQDNNGNDNGNSGCSDVGHVQDPSGYVYEGVTSNRMEGVLSTIYFKEMVEDMYGDLHENIVKWDASEYAQDNPIFTDEYGMYAWDVPDGLWQVKFEKEGYETTYSEWLPVPPPQLDVNIAMKQNVQPTVMLARAYEDAVEVEFDKYMMPELLTTENIRVIAPSNSPGGGEIAVEGTIELLNNEASYEGSTETFASKIRFNAAQPFTEEEITLMVSNRVKSYAGICMQDDYQQTFAIEQEIKQILSDSLAVVGYGEKATLTVSVLPASASKDKTLSVKTSSPMILGVETEQVVIDNNGKAEITVSGELPGTAALTFSVEGTDKTALTIASVEQRVYAVVAAPTANIASGSVVEKETKIELFCSTEGATIYYTLDGSCPCEDTDARKVYDGTPIVINETTTIKAMAVAPDMTESDVAEFNYVVNGIIGIEDVAINGQIRVYPLPVHDELNITAGGKTIKSVTISFMNGVLVASSANATTKVTLDVSKIPTGIYIINITTDSGSFSRKILKV